MKAAIFKSKGVITVEDRPKPAISEPTDAIVRVVLACVCGSDLWFYRGISDHPEGCVGHEFIGVVDETGDDVKGMSAGDFVIAPFSFSDGICKNCEAGFQTACIHGGFFGQGSEGDGGQAEYVRVPHADGTLLKVPGSDFSDETMASLLALTDVMATGYHAAVSAGVKAGDTVAVVGDGAVGLSGVLSARMLGAERIIVLGSTTESRHALAREWGAPTSSPSVVMTPSSSCKTLPTATAPTLSWSASAQPTQPPPRSPSPRRAPSSAASACPTTPRSTPRAPSTATSVCAVARLRPGATSPSC